MCCGRPGATAQTIMMGGDAKRRSPSQNVRPGQVAFEYVGRTALTVIGAVTGMKYRFAYPRHRLSVDRDDQAGMDQVPVLRRMID